MLFRVEEPRGGHPATMARRRAWVALTALVVVTACAGEQRDSPSPASTTGHPSPSAAPTESAVVTVDDVVSELLDALGAAASRRAWSLLSSRSQQGFGSYEDFAQLSSDYAEGLAAFADADRSHIDLGGGVSVVTLSGEVNREGMTEKAAAALAVRREDGQPRVELTPPHLADVLVIEVPEPGAAPLESGAELRATVPVGSRVTVLVDAEAYGPRMTPSDGDRMLVTLAPDLTEGSHVLTVAAVRTDGLLFAQAVEFGITR